MYTVRTVLCSRCKAQHTIPFFEFEKGVEQIEGVTYTHYGYCINFLEPILATIGEPLPVVTGSIRTPLSQKCPKCGSNHELAYKEFRRNFMKIGNRVVTRWTFCEKTMEPILEIAD